MESWSDRSASLLEYPLLFDQAARRSILSARIRNLQHGVELASSVRIGQCAQLLAAKVFQLGACLAPSLDEFLSFFVRHIAILLRF
jgi:hypothetical protein